MAVVPANLHIAKKGPQIIDVPQGVPREPPAADSNGPATAATLPPPPETKLPGNVTVTIVDGKTGLKREVVVAAPERPAAAPDALRPEQSNNIDTPAQTGRKAPIDPSDQLAPCQRGERNRQADSVAGDAGLVTGLHKMRIIAHPCLPLRAFF